MWSSNRKIAVRDFDGEVIDQGYLFPRTAQIMVTFYFDKQRKEEKKEKTYMRDGVGFTRSKQLNMRVKQEQFKICIFVLLEI